MFGRIRRDLEMTSAALAATLAERDRVLASLTVAQAERDGYLRQRDEAIGERDAYLRQRDEAIGERDAYLRQRDEAIGELDACRRQQDEAIGERDTYLRQRDEAIGERDAYLRQRDEAIGARDAYLRQRDEAIGERDGYLRARDDAIGERDTYVRQRDEAVGARDAYLRQRDEAIGERDTYVRQRDEAIGDRDAYLRQRDEAIGELETCLRQRDEAIGERDTYLRQRDEAIGERDTYLCQRDEAIGERDTYLRQRDEAIGDGDEDLRQRDRSAAAVRTHTQRTVMGDFTLVIPTHNRAHLLEALLNYLETEQADCCVLVLDSSHPEILEANRQRVAASKLNVEFAEFMNVDANEKWRQGIHRVSTSFCALCADDDLVILEGVSRCLDVLRGNPAASVVQGYSFSFLPRLDGNIELNSIRYFTPTIDDSSPLARLNKLFQRYQDTTYGIFRTPALQRIFDVLQPMTTNLFRELLGSALAVVNGQLIRLPIFSHGRSMGASGVYEYWHPLEWFCKDSKSLFTEYLYYRELLAAAVIQRPDNEHQLNEIQEVLDLIHLRYLVQHAPSSVLKFIIEQKMAGLDFAEYWSRHELQLPLYKAAGIGGSVMGLAPANMPGRDRSYVLSPSFYDPMSVQSPQWSSVVRLISVLDNYRTLAPKASVAVSSPAS
jgi:glycosyltransferase domain-containing protein